MNCLPAYTVQLCRNGVKRTKLRLRLLQKLKSCQNPILASINKSIDSIKLAQIHHINPIEPYLYQSNQVRHTINQISHISIQSSTPFPPYSSLNQAIFTSFQSSIPYNQSNQDKSFQSSASYN